MERCLNNKNKMKSSLLFIFFGFLVFSPACNEDKKTDTKSIRPISYYYYPKVNVYFDPQGSGYVFLDKETNTWKISSSLPPYIGTRLGKNVIIHNPPDSVWKKNEEHRFIYSASLYASSADFRDVPTVSIPKTSVTGKDSFQKDPKKKKGLGRFIDRVFNKKSEGKKIE
jgi:hypothetical protein